MNEKHGVQIYPCKIFDLGLLRKHLPDLGRQLLESFDDLEEQ